MYCCFKFCLVGTKHPDRTGAQACSHTCVLFQGTTKCRVERGFVSHHVIGQLFRERPQKLDPKSDLLLYFFTSWLIYTVSQSNENVHLMTFVLECEAIVLDCIPIQWLIFLGVTKPTASWIISMNV